MAFHRGPDLRAVPRAMRRLGYSWRQVAAALCHIAEFGTVEDFGGIAPPDRPAVEEAIPDSTVWDWPEWKKPVERIGYAPDFLAGGAGLDSPAEA